MSRRGENIYKRKDGRWEGRFSLTIDGKRVYKSVYDKNYKAVKEKLNLAKTQHIYSNSQQVINTNNYINSNNKAIITAVNNSSDFTDNTNSDYIYLWENLAQKWLAHIYETRKYSTYIKYLSVYNNYLKQFDGLNVYVLNKHVAEWRLNVCDCSDSLIHDIYRIINQIIKYANATLNATIPTIAYYGRSNKQKKILIFNHSEQKKFFNFLSTNPDSYKSGILLCFFTGLRLGEICSLKWEDIDFSCKILHVNSTVQRIKATNGENKTFLYENEPKSDYSKREIPLSDIAVSLLCSMKKSGRYVIAGDKPLEPRTYQNRLKSYLAKSDIAYHNFHSIRHTFATNCIEAGMDVKCLSELLGHANVQITLNRYVHPSLNMKRQYMNILAANYGHSGGQK